MGEDSSFSISGALREGWELTKLNVGFLIVYQIILFFFTWLFYISEHPLMRVIGFFVISLGWLGLYRIALLLTKGLKPTFDQFYINWKFLADWIIAGILFGLMFGIGLLLFIIPGLYALVLFLFYPFFILDKSSGPIQSLKRSANLTKGERWHILAFLLACVGVNLLGLLFFGIGIFITTPIVLIAIASVYERMTYQSETSIQPDDILD